MDLRRLRPDDEDHDAPTFALLVVAAGAKPQKRRVDDRLDGGELREDPHDLNGPEASG